MSGQSRRITTHRFPVAKRGGSESDRLKVAAAFERDIKRRDRLAIRLRDFDTEIISKAVECFKSHAAAALWLTRPQYGLNGCIPVQIKITPRTKEEILSLICRIEHGVF